MRELFEAGAQLFDTAGAWIREQLAEYPLMISTIGGTILMLVILNLVSMPLRIAWWRLICWRNRLAGKLWVGNFRADLADAIIAVTNRYYVTQRISKGERKEVFTSLMQALNLPGLNPNPRYQRPLHPYQQDRLREKTVQALGGPERAAEKLITARANKARPKVKLTVVNGTKAA